MKNTDTDIGNVSNLGPSEIRKRRVMGITSLAVGIGIAFLMVATSAPRWSRLVVFLPLWIAGLGLFQAKEKT